MLVHAMAAVPRLARKGRTVPQAASGTLYRGREGMWTWVAHRISGVLIFLFLFAHVLDTALVRVSPDAYNSIMTTYKTPIVGLGELGLVAAVIFHALNGIRIILVDFWSRGPARAAPDELGRPRPLRDPVRAVRDPAPDPRLRLRGPEMTTPVSTSSTDRGRLVTELTTRSPYQRTSRARGNFELWSWLFMRGSGVVLLVLVFGHLFVNLMLGQGIKSIDFAFVAGKWASPFWQTWDLLMLWLAEIHGVNGVRTIINDYTEKDSTRLILKTLLAVSAILVLVLGTLVIFTFDPCIDPASTLSQCKAQ